MLPKLLHRRMRQAEAGGEEYENKVELVGTSTVEVEESSVETATMSVLEKSKQHLEKVEQVVNVISEKTKGKLLFLFRNLYNSFNLNFFNNTSSCVGHCTQCCYDIPSCVTDFRLSSSQVY